LDKSKYEKLEASASSMHFLGDISGEGVAQLRLEVGKVLTQYSFVENAYFSRLQYKGEETTRVCLIIDAETPTDQVASAIVSQCSGLVPMDIMFSESVNSDALKELRTTSQPLFSNDNVLFECPLLISRGTNKEMPQEWAGAIQTYFVSAEDYKSALLKAVNDIKSHGYVFENVHDGKVAQLDVAHWWDEYVMSKWREYSDHFPSQAEMEVIVRVGSMHRGPISGWE